MKIHNFDKIKHQMMVIEYYIEFYINGEHQTNVNEAIIELKDFSGIGVLEDFSYYHDEQKQIEEYSLHIEQAVFNAIARQAKNFVFETADANYDNVKNPTGEFGGAWTIKDSYLVINGVEVKVGGDMECC